MMRILHCAWCKNPSVNQYGQSPFDQLGQLKSWPSIFLHQTCADELTRGMVEIADANHSDSFVENFRGNYRD